MRKFFIIFLFIYAFVAHISLVYAAQSADYSQSGVQTQIKDYLCTPTDGTTYVGQSSYFGFGGNNAGSGAANAASGDLYKCINKLYRFALALCSVIAVFFIVIAGYIYMSANGSQESVDKAKDMLVTSITGLVILFAGYMLLKTINPDLIEFKNIQPPAVTGLAPSGVTSAGTLATVSGTNVCRADTSNCTSGGCSQYSNEIADAAKKFPIPGINTAALINSIMVNESSCSPAAHSGANSFGLMQLQVATANSPTYKSGCTTDNVTSGWLTDPRNAAAEICIGAHYLQSLASAGCGSSPIHLAAGYNGGSVACESSRDCPATQSCDGSTTMRKWECPYDALDHSKENENTGYKESRNYAPKVLGCYNTYNH